MEKAEILDLLRQVERGAVSPEAAAQRLKLMPYEDLGFAKVDHHRAVRQGAKEVIYGAGKTAEQILQIARSMLAQGVEDILVTRVPPETGAELTGRLPASYDPASRICVVAPRARRPQVGNILVACAGTSDLPVAEEAAQTAEALGNRVTRLYDVGVSGLHRLLDHLEELTSARVVIAIAGMEGALASVIGGLVDCPVVAVPTSVGYGASFGGLSALLSMLNSCASGVSVVNIDNGFGAGYLASMINQMEGFQ